MVNRNALMETATREIARARRYRNDLIVIMLDLDHFKQLNDSHDHPADDTALKLFADCVREEARQTDLVAR
jgi:diguanylate cyclase (GGDEF)-like protein